MTETRRRLPNRRAGEIIAVTHDHMTYDVGISRFDDDTLAEVFVRCRKGSSAMSEWARDVGILLSLALQWGVPVETIAAAQPRLTDGTPSGLVGAVLDAILEVEKGG